MKLAVLTNRQGVLMLRKLSASILALSLALLGLPPPAFCADPSSSENPEIISDAISFDGSPVQDTQIPAAMIAATQTGPQETQPVSLVSSEEPAVPAAGGAALDAELDRIAGLFDSVGTVDPNAPALPGVNSTEVAVVLNYINALSALLRPLDELHENLGWATETQRNRIRNMFETHFSAMIHRATDLGHPLRLGDPVKIASGWAGSHLWFYVRSGLATPSRALALYRELKNNQDRVFSQLQTIMTDASTAADFQTPYDQLLRPFDSDIGHVAWALCQVEEYLVPMLGRAGTDLTPAQQREARDAIRVSATERVLAMASLYEGAQRLGIPPQVLAAHGLPGRPPRLASEIYGNWARVMRAVSGLVTEGEEAAVVARSAYTGLAEVTSRIRGIIACSYPGDSVYGYEATREVLTSMPIDLAHLLTVPQRTQLLEDYRLQFQTARRRFIDASEAAPLGGLLRIRVNVGPLITAARNLIGTTMPREEWRAIYTGEFGLARVLAIDVDRMRREDQNLLPNSEVATLAGYVADFASLMVQMLDQPPFSELPRDEFQRAADEILALFLPLITGLEVVAASAPQVSDRDVRAQAVRDSAQCGYEFLQSYVRRRLEEAPAPIPVPSP